MFINSKAFMKNFIAEHHNSYHLVKSEYLYMLKQGEKKKLFSSSQN